MQEWVDTLRLKLREMKILSPKENLYSKLPEVRPPLLPTRDPTRDPLPLPPPVPAAIVPGVIVNTTQSTRAVAASAASVTSSSLNASSSAVHIVDTPSSLGATSSAILDGNERNATNVRQTAAPLVSSCNTIDQNVNGGNEASNSFVVVDTTLNAITTAPIASTSNTLPQNLIKMLYPLPNFSHQSSALNKIVPDDCENGGASFVSENQTAECITTVTATASNALGASDEKIEQTSDSLARKFAASVTFDPNISSSTHSQHVTTISNGSQSSDDTISVDSSVYGIYPAPEPIVIPR